MNKGKLQKEQEIEVLSNCTLRLSVYQLCGKEDLPLLSVSLPPERAPRGSRPFGVRPFNCNTLSLSSL